MTPGTAAGGVLLAQVAPSFPAVGEIRAGITRVVPDSVPSPPCVADAWNTPQPYLALIYSLIGKVSRAINISSSSCRSEASYLPSRIPACPYRPISCLSLWDLKPHRRGSGKAPTPGFLLQLFWCRTPDPALPAGHGWMRGTQLARPQNPTLGPLCHITVHLL